MLGLRRGTVALMPHEKEWEDKAGQAIALLRKLLGETALDIQHVGSTAIRSICAKPILDIALGVRELDDIMPHIPLLERHGVIYRKQDIPGQLLFVMGDMENDMRTHHIHVVEHGGVAWQNYLNFRDYLNAIPEQAARYDALKRRLAADFAVDRGKYTSGKQELIDELLEKARVWRKENI